MNIRLLSKWLFAVVLMLLVSAAAHAAQWTKRAVGVPRPNYMPPSHKWYPESLTLVYDSNRRVTVGIGGYADPSLYFLPVSEFNGSNWISRYDGYAANTPTYRHIGDAVFDSWRNVTVIFGGWVGNTENALDELWEYNGSTWTQRTWTSAGPRKSVHVQMCFDPFRGRTICLTLSPTRGSWEAWEWTGSAWDRGPDLTGVDDTNTTRMVFDVSRNRAFVYTTQHGGIFERTYEYTPGPTAAQGVWRNVPISGSQFEAYIGVALVYDPYRQRIIRHGGRAVTGIYGFIDGTFAWDPAQSRWSLFASLPEQGRGGASMCFDTQRVMAVLYGGTRIYIDQTGVGRATTYTDTWEFVDNVPGDTWVDFTYTGSETGSPQQPWNSLADALSRAPAGGMIFLKTGSSPERFRSTDYRTAPVVLRAWNGPVTIGR